jgi:predicted phosphate transport protein (TIGR00153 family)
MFGNLFPKEYNFFNSFDMQADYLTEAAEYFGLVTTKGEITEDIRKGMRAIEHKGDEIAYSIIDQLNKTFITPFDREDIHSLVKELDDVNDVINTLVGRLSVFKLSADDKTLKEFAVLIEQSVKYLVAAVKGLRDMKNMNNILKSCVEVGRLESQGDKLRDRAFRELFENPTDAFAVMKWKEIYQIAETALDICKRAAHNVESILVKQA